uniref:Uncharacterized protein n=1 Tax=Triticum aestivum TaxID=4565 RepID=A0A077RZ56_WHEAT|nr:unnamed protein product [Triticum aestivum]
MAKQAEPLSDQAKSRRVLTEEIIRFLHEVPFHIQNSPKERAYTMLRMNGGGKGSDYGSLEPGATSMSMRSWSTTTAFTNRSIRVASMVMGMMISMLRVRATCDDEGEDELSEALKRRGRAEEHVEDHINAAQELVALGEVVGNLRNVNPWLDFPASIHTILTAFQWRQINKGQFFCLGLLQAYFSRHLGVLQVTLAAFRLIIAYIVSKTCNKVFVSLQIGTQLATTTCSYMHSCTTRTHGVSKAPTSLVNGWPSKQSHFIVFVKIPGFVSVFKPLSDAAKSRRIPTEEMMRFLQQVPFHIQNSPKVNVNLQEQVMMAAIMGAQRPGAKTMNMRIWSTTTAFTTRSTWVPSMEMGKLISRLRVRATCEDEGKDELSEALKRRGSIRMRRCRTWSQR